MRDARAYEECVRSRRERETRVDNARAARSYAKVESHFLGEKKKRKEKRDLTIYVYLRVHVCVLVCARTCTSIGPDETFGYFSIFDITRISSIFSSLLILSRSFDFLKFME